MTGDAHDHDEHGDHDHVRHDHDHHEHGHHEHEHEAQPDLSGWIRSTQTTTCPACAAPGALTLGGGVFCPTCGEITTSPGYQATPTGDTQNEPGGS